MNKVPKDITIFIVTNGNNVKKDNIFDMVREAFTKSNLVEKVVNVISSPDKIPERNLFKIIVLSIIEADTNKLSLENIEKTIKPLLLENGIICDVSVAGIS